MSMKVYDAYRMKEGVDVWKLNKDIYQKGRAEVVKQLKEIYLDLASRVNEDDEEYKDVLQFARIVSPLHAKLRVVQNRMQKGFREATVSLQRDYFDFNVKITFREYDGRIYIRHYSNYMMRGVLDFMAKDKRLESFDYWDNTDPPKEFANGKAYQDWKARGDIWEKVYSENQYIFLTLEICSWDAWMWIDPGDELVKEEVKRFRSEE